MEKIRITEWKDGCVYRTASEGTGWFSDRVLEANYPLETNVIYIAANDHFAKTNMTIRKVKQ